MERARHTMNVFGGVQIVRDWMREPIFWTDMCFNTDLVSCFYPIWLILWFRECHKSNLHMPRVLILHWLVEGTQLLCVDAMVKWWLQSFVWLKLVSVHCHEHVLERMQRQNKIAQGMYNDIPKLIWNLDQCARVDTVYNHQVSISGIFRKRRNNTLKLQVHVF